jgi:putative phosphoesterase
MKIAVIADIHSNLAALDAVLAEVDAWGPGQVLVAGDVVNRGPQPVECLERILARQRDHGWHVLRGNHEDFVLWTLHPPADELPWQKEVVRFSVWTREQLGDRVTAIAGWPDHVELDGPDGQKVRSVHASMVHNRHGLYAHMSDDELYASMTPAPAVLCVGHTHVPFIRRIEQTLLLNAGAVGLPFDRDPRAAWAKLEYVQGAWHAEVLRVEYDRALTEEAVFSSGFADQGGPMVPLILDELRHARPRLRQWHDEFEPLVAQGAMTVEESVTELLQQ